MFVGSMSGESEGRFPLSLTSLEKQLSESCQSYELHERVLNRADGASAFCMQCDIAPGIPLSHHLKERSVIMSLDAFAVTT